MKQLIQLGIISNLLLSTTSFALNPVQGFYVGLIGEVSRGPSSSDEVFTFTTAGITVPGKVSYSPISGGAGATFGYKFRHFRLEAEILYNRISTGPFEVGSCTLQSSNVETPTGACPAWIYDRALGYNGSSAAFYGMANAFWDFFSYENNSPTVPFIGVGLGKAQIKTGSNFTNTISDATIGATRTNSSTAAQGIIGVSYFMDDYAWVALDYRYLTTNSLSAVNKNRYTLNTLNFTVDFAFDKGGA